MMKRFIPVMLLLAMFSGLQAAAPRGERIAVVNIVTCVLEIPRCMVYRNCEMPFWGLIAGAVDGTGCTVMRAVTGVTDILFLGFDYGTAFNRSFRPYVWDSRWLPPTPVKGDE